MDQAGFSYSLLLYPLILIVIVIGFSIGHSIYRLHRQDRERFEKAHKALKSPSFNLWRERSSQTHFIARNFDAYKEAIKEYKEKTGAPDKQFTYLALKEAEKKWLTNADGLVKHVEFNSFFDHENKELRSFSASYMFKNHERYNENEEKAFENLKKILDKLDSHDKAMQEAKDAINAEGKYYFRSLYDALTAPKKEEQSALIAWAFAKKPPVAAGNAPKIEPPALKAEPAPVKEKKDIHEPVVSLIREKIN